jgi:tRNA (adenine22-N1)-methyltransferase
MRPVQLDERLQTIGEQVRTGSRVADVGCDHAYLICALTESGKIPGGIACDIREGPLSQAEREVAARKLTDKIDCRLGDGLSVVSEQEVDDVVIAGMGGEQIAAILEACTWEKKSDKRFLLQPMTRAPMLRRWLYANGYAIDGETACEAANRPYTVMCVRYTGKQVILGEYDLYTYIGDLGESPGDAARAYIHRAAIALVRRENGLLGRSPAEAQKLRVLSNKMLAMIEGW